MIHFPSLGNNLTHKELKEIDLEKEDFQIKISDFGLKRYCEIDSDNCDYLLFDELIFKKECKYNLDTWALGFLFFHMLTGVKLSSCEAIKSFSEEGDLSLNLTKDCHTFLFDTLNPE